MCAKQKNSNSTTTDRTSFIKIAKLWIKSSIASFRMSLKKGVFRCTCIYSDKSKEPVPIEIDVKRVNNTVQLSLVITNKSPEKGYFSLSCPTKLIL